ncbi:PucR family transcriptional regulator ligand-binding domain-containing protein [Chromohalobacter israelensis]|uniref:PucR family transcriptional regulator ligand-binding domain-containing protein n=1 Tax=Chromohalobacter israelensis TaxID=141390 RepID=UPI003D79DD48
MAITCAEIPRLPGLEEIRFRAGLQGGNRPVRWPYVAENDAIAPWVRGGELVFVTGINLHRSEANLKQLVKSYGDFWCTGGGRKGWRILLIDHDQDLNQQEWIRHDRFYPPGSFTTRTPSH